MLVEGLTNQRKLLIFVVELVWNGKAADEM